MDQLKIQSLIKDQNWSNLSLFLERDLVNAESSYSELELLNIFDSINRDYRDEALIHLYPKIWKMAFDLGQIKLAKQLIETLIDHLIANKRLHQLKILEQDVQKILPKKSQTQFQLIDILNGKRKILTDEEYEYVQLHPEQWKHNKEALKSNIIYEANWDVEGLKLIYEYIIRFNFDKEIISYLAEKNLEVDNDEARDWNKSFIKLLKSKKIDTYHLENHKKSESKKEIIDSKDLDLVVLNLFSKTDIKTDEEGIILHLKFLDEEELKTKGQEMIIAFSFLTMSKVVNYLCEELLKISSEVKNRVSLIYTIAQSLYDCENYYKCIDVSRDVMDTEVLLDSEKVAFKYLIAESYLSLGKKEKAKMIYKELMKTDSNYRLVKERYNSL